MRRVSLLVFVFLAACADTYTPQSANPGSANVSAVATLTAASSYLAATAAANSKQATAVAQRATATASSVQATSQAQTAATATVLSALGIVEVFSTQTAVSIISNRETANSTATAVALVRIQAKQETADSFWLWIRVVILVALSMAILLLVRTAKIVLWRWETRPDLLEDGNGRAIAHRSDYKSVRARVTVPPATQRQPQRNGRPVFIQHQDTATRANFAPMTADEATAVSNWLNAVAFTTAAFNRDGAAVYNIGHPRADGIIDLAISSGYASKDGGRSSPVIPARNFVEFQDMLFPNQSQNS